MAERYAGKLTFDDGGSVAVDLEMSGDVLNLSTDGKPVGSWPIKYCRVSRTGTGSFLLSIDGEKVVFTPNDVEPFSLAAAQRFHASTLADRIGVIRDVTSPVSSSKETPTPAVEITPEPVREPRAVDWRTIGALIGIVGVLVIAGLMALTGGDEPTPVSPTVPATTSTTVVQGLPELFDQKPAEFVAAWNETATSLGVRALITQQLTIGTFETQVAPFVSVLGTTDESDDTINSVVIVVDPRGETEDDQLAIAILGVAIAVADPDLDGPGRRAVLETLGLDVSNPSLVGLDGEADDGAIRYTMQYFDEFSSLLLSIMES